MPPPTSMPPSAGDERDLSRTYLLVFVVEAIVVGTLYLVGRIFA